MSFDIHEKTVVLKWLFGSLVLIFSWKSGLALLLLCTPRKLRGMSSNAWHTEQCAYIVQWIF